MSVILHDWYPSKNSTDCGTIRKLYNKDMKDKKLLILSHERISHQHKNIRSGSSRCNVGFAPVK